VACFYKNLAEDPSGLRESLFMSDEETKLCKACGAQGALRGVECASCDGIGFEDITSADGANAVTWWKSLTRPEQLAEHSMAPSIAIAWVNHKKTKAAPVSNPPPAAT
jgi:hypothetical protein